MDAVWSRWARVGLWLLPLYGALTLLATLTHQPDPAADFRAWSQYVTTTRFYASHVGASILGLALGTLGVVSLGLLLSRGRRARTALTAVVLHVLGASVIWGLFGVAAFVQPAMGAAFLGGETAAPGWYDAVFGAAATLVPSIVGLTVFSAASVLLGWALAAHERVPLWVAVGYGSSGVLIGLLGVTVGVLQTVGSLLLVVSSAIVALRVGEPAGAAAPAAPAPSAPRPP